MLVPDEDGGHDYDDDVEAGLAGEVDLEVDAILLLHLVGHVVMDGDPLVSGSGAHETPLGVLY